MFCYFWSNKVATTEWVTSLISGYKSALSSWVTSRAGLTPSCRSAPSSTRSGWTGSKPWRNPEKKFRLSSSFWSEQSSLFCFKLIFNAYCHIHFLRAKILPNFTNDFFKPREIFQSSNSNFEQKKCLKSTGVWLCTRHYDISLYNQQFRAIVWPFRTYNQSYLTFYRILLSYDIVLSWWT